MPPPPPPPPKILDSHIHLWPASAANPQSHTWMQTQPGHTHPLAHEHSISDYLASCGTPAPSGFVYVETDRALPTSPPPDSDSDSDISDAELRRYAAQPLEEIRFLRRIVEGEGVSEGNGAEHKALLKGIVLWAPVHLGPKTLRRYLVVAEQTAGAETWGLVKGFRVLLQGWRDREGFLRLVTGEAWIGGLAELGARGFAFDVGVDQRGGGVWQLEGVVEMVVRLGRVGTRPRLILNHLCKPDVRGRLRTAEQLRDYARWVKVMEVLAGFPDYPGIYVKLSGAFSEMEDQDESDPLSTDDIAEQLKPWVDVVLNAFGPDRVMFGSDWPVCNVGGPGEGKSWKSWQAYVAKVIADRGLESDDETGASKIWGGCCCKRIVENGPLDEIVSNAREDQLLKCTSQLTKSRPWKTTLSYHPSDILPNVVCRDDHIPPNKDTAIRPKPSYSPREEEEEEEVEEEEEDRIVSTVWR
ncbi:hypothetical protein EJ05DRAFT_538242 [Pseudovirgaria hyperparasitica]|uniref:Amidohydrolase-related domain-containing protein n=1 Tax=Pseudovirgaria hyperparasitica TaxID=470096 RepID=A0A6A6W7H3_9PEZI|nr:uncharacterized protein EJ05DRAFT_538242 [Pseudovirgaria hyperparasitica]KAF2757974.1 hypothetical protein EJ05DRAFT_538242 [Pseudovirgaria hyperparasitica]